MPECLNAYIFTRRLGLMDGHGPVIVAARDLADAEQYYRDAVREKHKALLKECGQEQNFSRQGADSLAEEDLRLMEVKEVPIVSGAFLLNEGM
ncbi:MAG: hypothetical protein A3J53_00285 [Candidatus Harrisonbacteria bacterium RIFCSPHIGHO2_02_FULL_40_20]|nr:MAG: hypothetical protein A3J53_00285 [Candidatus Harrisonbacteria bacterium RIFCSPHIGHO2_02_FULL_40_20]